MEFDANLNVVPTEGVSEGKVAGAVSTAWFIFTYVSLLMATIKRFHDLGMSGWHCVVFYFPIPVILLMVLFMLMTWKIAAMVTLGAWVIVALWYMIKLFFFAGDPIENQYGPVRGDVAPFPAQALMVVGTLFLVAVAAGYNAYTVIAPMAKERAAKQMAALAAPIEAARLAEELKQKAADDLKTRAENGDASAQYDYAFTFMSGQNTATPDYAAAAKWLEKSALQDYAPAQYNLGLLYFEGKGYAIDHGRAYFWLSRAQLRGHAPGQTDYRAAAGAQLTPEQRADIEKRAAEWKPATTAPVAAPAPAPQPAPPQPPAP